MSRIGTNLDEQLAALLAEGAELARQREARLFDQLADFRSQEIVLFGAGNLGRRTLKGLRELGIQPACFVDNNPARGGENVEGLTVSSPSDAAGRYGKDAIFVITVWGALGTDRMASRVAQLQKLGCTTVVPFVPLYWKYSGTFLPHYTIDLPHQLHLQADRVQAAFNLMADDQSRREYIAQVRFRLLGDFDNLPDPVSGPIYFRDDLFKAEKDEVYVDCGGFDGDSLSLFLAWTGNSFRSAVVFEPDPANFEKLERRVSSLPASLSKQITLYRAATGKINEKVMMEVGSGPSSQIGKGDLEVESLALDNLLEGHPVTFIKMDIEGSEMATLEGAEKVIRENAPILAISAYHRQSDLWNIPLLIHSFNPDYSFYLRPHMIEGWDLVCYAVPSSRKS
ncbi:FkbM family methyltransferase [Acidobacteria bacterium AB60]|nr:FkbM family methyltransferase [Acidobacteria bacterium AB60]